jgi:hypothetical protein
MLAAVSPVAYRRQTLQVLALCCLPLLGCAPVKPVAPEIVIPATDYAFQLPKEISAGRTQFRLENRGKVAHEVAMGQLRAGYTADSVLARMAAGGDPGDMTDGLVGVLIAGPATTSLGSLSADLLPGRTYMMICQFKDADSLPPHVVMGMYASFVAQ